jgi:hypothetical protein
MKWYQKNTKQKKGTKESTKFHPQKDKQDPITPHTSKMHLNISVTYILEAEQPLSHHRNNAFAPSPVH